MTEPDQIDDASPKLGEATPDGTASKLEEKPSTTSGKLSQKSDEGQPSTSGKLSRKSGELPAEPSSNLDEGETPDPETFPREYVEQLRQENGKFRQRAQRADDLGQRLHLALVTATGKLADPTDLPFDETHLDDAAALGAAIDDLLGRKPHLATRRPTGDVGQGASTTGDTVNLAGILRANAM